MTVTVRDPGGLEAAQSFVVSGAEPGARRGRGPSRTARCEVDSVAALDLAPYFTEPDRDPLAYAVRVLGPRRGRWRPSPERR